MLFDLQVFWIFCGVFQLSHYYKYEYYKMKMN